MGYFSSVLSINCRTVSIEMGWLVRLGGLRLFGPVLIGVLLLIGCGQKGDLFLPEPEAAAEQEE